MKFLAAAVAVLGLCTSSFAATISDSGTFLYDPISTTGGPGTITLDLFDPGMGTLTGVTVTVKQTTNGEVTNTDANLNADATLTSTVTFDAAGKFSASTSLPATPGVTSFTNIPVAGTETVVNAMSSSSPFTGPLANFIGPGTFDVDLTNTGGWLISAAGSGGSGSVSATFDSDTLAEVTITYAYIPEPATMGLLAVGGLAVLRRRR